MPIDIDASTPAFAAASNDPWVTASFTPPVGSTLLVAVVGDRFSIDPTQGVTSAGLTFTQIYNVSADDNGEITWFICHIGASGGSARTVSATTTETNDTGGVKVWVLTGVDTTTTTPDATGGGAGITTDNFTASPALTTTVDGARVFGAGVEWQSLGAPTSADAYENFDDADLSLIVVRKAAATSPAGDVTLNFDAAGASPKWIWGAVALRPASLRSSSQLAGADRTSIQVPVPPGASAGDIAVVGMFLQSANTITPASGFSVEYDSGLSGNVRLAVYWKRLTGADSGTWDFTTSSTQWTRAVAGLWMGRAASGNPFTTDSGAHSGSGAASLTVPGVTAAADDALIGIATCFNDATWTPPSGMTELRDWGEGMFLGTQDHLPAGATGNKTFTPNSTSAISAWIGALAPFTGAAPLDGRWQLEDGTGNWLLEDGSGYWVTEDYVGTSTIDAAPTAIATGYASGTTVVTGLLSTAPSAISTGEAHGTPAATIIPPAQTMTPTAISTGYASGTPVVSTVVTATATGIPTAVALGTPIVTTVLASSATGIPTSEAFGTPAAANVLNAQPSAIATALAFGNPTSTTLLSVVPSGLVSAEAFGTTLHINVRTMIAGAVASLEAHGSPMISTTGPTLSAQPSGVGSAESLGLVSASSLLVVGATAIPTGAALGSPSALTVLTSTPVGVATGLVMGNPTVTGVLQVSPSGIATLVALGAPSISNLSFSAPTAIGSALAFGTTVATSLLTSSPASVASMEAFGVALANAIRNTTPNGISSALAFGSATVDFRITATPQAINTAVVLGSPIVSGVLGASPAGVGSGEALGAPVMSGVLDTMADSISSLTVMGSPIVQTLIGTVAMSIGSLEEWGNPLAEITAATLGRPGARDPRVRFGKSTTTIFGGGSSTSLRANTSSARRSNGNDGAWITQA